jgi:hypothetical protein
MLLSHTSLKENELASQSKHQKYEESLRRDDHSAFHAAFAAVFRQPDPRIHRDQLPPPPYNWKEAQRHPRRDGFIAAGQREYQALESKGTFQKASRPQGLQVSKSYHLLGFLRTNSTPMDIRSLKRLESVYAEIYNHMSQMMKMVVVVQYSKRTS